MLLLLLALSATPADTVRECERLDAEAKKTLGRGDPRAAVRLARRAVAAHEALGRRDALRGRLLTTLGQALAAAGDHQGARDRLEAALAALRIDPGEADESHALTLRHAALAYRDLGAMRASLAYFTRREDLVRRGAGPNSPQAVECLFDLALINAALARGDDALALARKALAITRAAVGEKHGTYCRALYVLGRVQIERGDFAAAAEEMERSRELAVAGVGRRHAVTLEIETGLMRLYTTAGMFTKAQALMEDLPERSRAARGVTDPGHLDLMEVVAGYLLDTGDLMTAEATLHNLLKAHAARHGERHPAHAHAEMSLAKCLLALGKPAQALPPAERALAIMGRAGGAASHGAIHASLTLGAVLRDLGRARDADSVLAQARDVARRLGAGHPLSAQAAFALAQAKLALDDPAAARPLLLEARDAVAANLGKDNPVHARILFLLAQAALVKGDTGEARRQADEALVAVRRYYTAASESRSERAQASAQHAYQAALALRLCLPGAGEDDYRHVLLTRGVVFEQQRRRRAFTRRLLAEKRPEARALLNGLGEVTGAMAQLSLAAPSGDGSLWRLRMMELVTARERLEVALGRLGISTAGEAPPTPEDVARALPAGSALIDYLAYVHFDPERKPSERHGPRVLAFVTRPGKGTVRVDLGDAAAAGKAIQAWREALAKGAAADDAAARAHARLWAPLEKHLAGVSHVLVAPDGPICFVPFAALPGRKAKTFLLEDHAVTVVPMPRLLPELLAARKAAGPSLLVVGDVRYQGEAWKRLPGTAAEVEAVEGAFRARFKDAAVSRLTATHATGEAVAAALPKHSVVHLATHGYFAGAAEAPAPGARVFRAELREDVAQVHPGLMSGLVLAGRKAVTTALEVAEMDLSGVELATLSACETGLGRGVSAGEGLVGLQRALLVAGARSTLTSLWSVDDAATSVLMEEFYARLWGKGKLSKLEALRQAQLFVLKHPEAVEKRAKALQAEYEKRGEASLLRGVGKAAERLPAGGAKAERVSPPVWWAGFVLSGDWR